MKAKSEKSYEHIKQELSVLKQRNKKLERLEIDRVQIEVELKEQAKPTEALEASEIDFGLMYLSLAEESLNRLEGHSDTMAKLEVYLSGTGSKLPTAAVDDLLHAAGCRTTDWSQMDINLIEGCSEIGDGRVQGSLF